MTSGGREFLKWLAAVFMTGDHALKILGLGYVPGIAELGRVAFPLFALVLAYNLAKPNADIEKSVKRLFLWGIIATGECSRGRETLIGALMPLHAATSST